MGWAGNIRGLKASQERVETVEELRKYRQSGESGGLVVQCFACIENLCGFSLAVGVRMVVFQTYRSRFESRIVFKRSTPMQIAVVTYTPGELSAELQSLRQAS
jgi:hypothetical protein